MRKLLAATALTLCLGTTATLAAEPLNLVFISHSSPSNTFWQAVKKGFDDGCAKVQAKGIMVLAVNVDDSQGAAGNERQAFIGQSFIAAGYSLGKAQSKNFPKDGPLRVLMGVSAPGQTWSEQRSGGVLKFMDDFKKDNPGRQITVDKIDSGTDLAVTADRVGAYLNAHPDTSAYFDCGYWEAGVARVLKDRGLAPGKILLGGFDLVPEVLQQMKSGYIQVAVDQQPYMQGFMPVMEAYLAKNFGLAAADIDTGQGIVTPDKVDSIMALSKQGLR